MLRKTAILTTVCLALACGRASASTLLDLSSAGATASATSDNGVDFRLLQVPDQSTGTGVIDPFVRIQQTGSERGYNTSLGTPLDDKSPAGGFTRALTLGEVPIVNIGGVDYRQFLLDINQTGANPLLSLNQIQIFQSASDMLHTGLTDATATTNANIAFAGATKVFQMSDLSTSQADSYEIKLDFSLNSGSGSGDMFLYVRNSAFSGPASTNLIFFSQFGAPPGQWSSNDGFEEWAVLRAGGGGGGGESPVPEPASLLLLGTGLGFMARRVRGRKKA